jgi:peroxiredoxin Q/BCP
MSEAPLRRSGRNAAKKNVPVPPSPAPEYKKRASAEPKNSTAKKIKTATDSTAIALKAALTKPVEVASSSRAAASPEEVGNAEKPAKATSKSIAKTTAKPMAVKSVANPAKTKKADEMSEGLKDGDLVPTDLPEIQTEDGSKTTIESLLKSAQKGIIIFAYPKGI